MFLGLVGGALVGAGVTLGLLGYLDLLNPASTPVTLPSTAPTTAPPPALSTNPSVTEVAATAVPSIVAVQVSGEGLRGGGSGVVYREDGYLLTNHHVIENAAEIFVIFADGIGYPAELVGSDPLTDIAVIRTARPDLTPIRLGAEADLIIGERTVAVGNPLGLQGGPSVTSGILSATGRALVVESGRILYGLLQTDAPITRGSSGGALLDQEAKLIGITTAIGVSDVGAEGLGFAVPVDMAVSVADDLIADGKVRHAFLGIRGGTVTQTRDQAVVPLGVGVSEAINGAAFARSGGRPDDVIVELDGRAVTSIEQMIARLRMRRADDVIAVRVLRPDASGEYRQELVLDVTLDEWSE